MCPIAGYRLESTDPLTVRALLDVSTVANVCVLFTRVIDCLQCYDLSGRFGRDAWLEWYAFTARTDGVLLELRFTRQPRMREIPVSNSFGQIVGMLPMYRSQRMDDLLRPLAALPLHPAPPEDLQEVSPSLNVLSRAADGS